MKTRPPPLRAPLALTLAALLTVTTPALAEKPDWAGNGKNADKRGNRQDDRQAERAGGPHTGRQDDGARASIEFRFGDDNRRLVNDYYRDQFRAGNCPPGLAKKRNGCLPPGQAKKWQRGRPLPSDLRYYDLPRELVLRLPVPPAGHRYVQIAADVLLIAIGTGMVVDAIEDIGRR